MAKTKFRTMYDHGEERYRAPIGDKIQIKHYPKMMANGRRKLEAKRDYPIYDIIQASKEETEVERIIKRAMEGDPSVLNAMNGVYADITDAPKSLAQAQQMIIDAKNEFKNLPKEIREKFENNDEIYIASMGSKEWLDNMGITAKMETKNNKTENIETKSLNDIAGTNALVQTGIEQAGGEINE